MTDDTPTKRFSGLAELYSRARPGYPNEAIDFIVSHCNILPNSLIVDVGSGTGISTRMFANRGLKVIGIEPNADMRHQAELEDSALRKQNKLEYREGTAENTGLTDGVADAVLAAQAFHWFEPSITLAEFHRILKPDGWVILMWNERDESDAFTKAYGDALRVVPETKNIEAARGKAGEILLTNNLFKEASCNVFSNFQTLNREELIARAFSASYAPKGKEAVNQLQKHLNDVFTQYQQSNVVKLCYITSVYTAKASPNR